MKNFILSFISLINFIFLKKENKRFVFFSESKFYRYHFFELLENLSLYEKEKIFFVCIDKDDYNFFNNKVKTIYIQNNFFLQIFFSSLTCINLILTLSDLGTNLIKSKNCENFIYFFHAFASTHKIYKKEAFKNYDIIFSNGPYQKKELEEAEVKFTFPKKIIKNIGYFYYDYLIKNINANISKKNCILFAPSWNYNNKNLFDDYGYEIIKILISSGFKVILRPHSEHFKRSKKQINKIERNFEKKFFLLDREKTNISSMEKSEILLTDNSSIISEFLFALKRPFIKINYVDKIHNESYQDLGLETLDDIIIKNFGNTIDIKDLSNLPNLIKKILETKIDNDKTNLFLKNNISNLGSSSKFAAKVLYEEF